MNSRGNYMYYVVRKDDDYWRFSNWSSVVHFLCDVLLWEVVQIIRHIEDGDSSLYVEKHRFKKSYSFRLLKRRYEILKEKHPERYEYLFEKS